MARYTDSVCRLCRREGLKLFLKGERCYTDKCAIERRNYPPGQYAGILVLRLPEDSTADDILAVVGSFFADAEIVRQLEGKLAILQPDSVRFRA